jgi:hypothetical protein
MIFVHKDRNRGRAFKSLSVLLWMAMVFCTVGAMIKREQAFTTVLNHWDEMMGYAAILALLGVFERSLPA